MITSILNMGGYGFFVWPAFIFTFVFCLFLYMKVKRDLRQHEKIFLNKLKFMPYKKFKAVKSRKIARTVLEKKVNSNY
tara:strand:- start:230 stop:463 length:234 start_codon:yes stop_codon:yes gene_type:complete